jgi:hypothetical protein
MDEGTWRRRRAVGRLIQPVSSGGRGSGGTAHGSRGGRGDQPWSASVGWWPWAGPKE